jgi:hypothetical protein
VVSELPSVDGEIEAISGLRISFPRGNAPAFWAGIRNGDIIIGFEGQEFTMPPEEVEMAFREMIKKKKVGDVVTLKYLRPVENTSLKINGKEIDPAPLMEYGFRYLRSLGSNTDIMLRMYNKWEVHTVRIPLGTRLVLKDPPAPDFFQTKLGQWIEKNLPDNSIDWKPWAEEAVDRYKIRKNYEDLRDRLKAINTTSDGTRISAMSTIHRHPQQTEKIARSFSHLAAQERAGFMQTFSFITSQKPMDTIPEFSDLSERSSIQEFRMWFEKNLEPINSALERAYAALIPEDREFFLKHRYTLTKLFVQSTYIHTDSDPTRFERNLRILEIAKKLDLSSLLEAACALEEFLHVSRPQVLAWMAAHSEIREVKTDFGKIGFGTTGRDLWTDVSFRFIFDPSGDDYYGDGTAAAISFEQPFSWIIDYAGNDVYRAKTHAAHACAVPGLAFVIDVSGDDSYLAKRWAQGAGYFGVGVLIDEAGSDDYHGTEYIQGCGLYGFGCLVDYKGNDRYFGNMYAQGIGMTLGLGLLYDRAGDDKGYCTGMQASGFGDSGLFNGWGQGCGVGFRGLTSGGIGAVLDVGGCDRWEGGAFSLGSGYYYGIGFFHAAGEGNDLYYGTRYTLGNTAHQGAGIFFDDAGNDVYTTGQCETTGIAWDESVALFIEGGGDDYYYGGTGFSLSWINHKWEGFSIGAAAQNGFTIFIDKSGHDFYDYSPGPGRADDNSYHGGTSFAFFIDLGSEQDTYTCPDVANDVERAWAQFGIFRDGKSIPLNPLRLLRNMKPFPYERSLNKN